MKTFMAVLLTWSLLACPFRCYGDTFGGVVSSPTGEAQAEMTVSSTCSCCSNRCPLPVEGEASQQDQSTENEPPVEDCDCQCLCKGGVQLQEDSVELDLMASAFGTNLIADPNLNGASRSEVQAHGLSVLLDHSLFDSGKEVRLHVSSLII